MKLIASASRFPYENRMEKRVIVDKNGIVKPWPKRRITADQLYVNTFKTERWKGMNQRTVNGSSPQWSDPVKAKYFEKGVSLEMSREEFYAFCDANAKLILELRDAGEKPSIDRIDHTRGYSLDNIRILSFRENCRLGSAQGKAKMKAVSCIPVRVIRASDNAEMGTFESQAAAARALGINFQSVSAGLNRKSHYSGGYYFYAGFKDGS
jgi:hypothetical protein